MLCFDITLEDVRVIGKYLYIEPMSELLKNKWVVDFVDCTGSVPSSYKFLNVQECQALLTMCMDNDEVVGNFPITDIIVENARKIIDPIVGQLPMELRPYPCGDYSVNDSKKE